MKRLQFPRGDKLQRDEWCVGEDWTHPTRLVGVRTSVANNVRLLIDGARREVTLKTKRWI
jgi:hypothetical protein